MFVMGLKVMIICCVVMKFWLISSLVYKVFLAAVSVRPSTQMMGDRILLQLIQRSDCDWFYFALASTFLLVVLNQF